MGRACGMNIGGLYVGYWWESRKEGTTRNTNIGGCTKMYHEEIG
jgi:hypothetical protein